MRHKESSYFLKILIIALVPKHNLIFNLHSIFILTKQHNFLIIFLHNWIHTSEQTHVIIFLNFINFFRKFLNSFVELLLSFYDLPFNRISFFSVLLFSFINNVIDHFRPSVDFSN